MEEDDSDFDVEEELGVTADELEHLLEWSSEFEGGPQGGSDSSYSHTDATTDEQDSDYMISSDAASEQDEDDEPLHESSSSPGVDATGT